MDMHGELQPLAAKMAKAASDAANTSQRMVGAGLCMEKFEDNPVVYESFAEVMWSGVAPATEEEVGTAWLSRYVERRYGGKSEAAMEAWAAMYAAFYRGTGEWGTTIRAWPPSTTAKGSFPFDASLPPAAFRNLLLARATVAPSGVASIEYDLARVAIAASFRRSTPPLSCAIRTDGR